MMFGVGSLFFMKEPERIAVEDECIVTETVFEKFKNSFKNMWKNPVTRYCSLAGGCRLMVTFSCDYFLPLFFVLSYPGDKVKFSLIYGMMQMVLGFASSVTGGILSKKLGPKNYHKICMASALLPLPFLWMTVLQTNSFAISILGAGMRYLFGEMYWSPNVAMM